MSDDTSWDIIQAGGKVRVLSNELWDDLEQDYKYDRELQIRTVEEARAKVEELKARIDKLERQEQQRRDQAPALTGNVSVPEYNMDFRAGATGERDVDFVAPEELDGIVVDPKTRKVYRIGGGKP